MASSSTNIKSQRIAARQRISVSDLEDISTLGLSNQAENDWLYLCADNAVIGGLDVQHVSGREFQINEGALIVNGEIVKVTSSGISLGEQDAIVAGTDDRIDIFYIDPSNAYTSNASDSASVTVLSSVSVASVSGEAVGTGDDATKTWDLANSGVDPSALLVYIAADQEADGWVFSKGTGTAGVDQIIFDVAPPAGDAITADYDYLTGGTESSTSSNTRYTRTIRILSAKGTEAVFPSAPSIPVGSLELARIQYGTGWTTGDPMSGAGAYTYDAKRYALTRDQANDNQYGSSWGGSTTERSDAFDRPPRVSDMIRNMSQVRCGCRLRYSTSDTIIVGPGWINSAGLSLRIESDVSLQLQSTVALDPGYVTGGAQWVYVYAVPAGLSAAGGGQAFTLDVGSIPNSLGHDTASPVALPGAFYLGSLYVTGTGPVVIQEFRTTSDGWYYFKNPAQVALSGTGNRDVAGNGEAPLTARKALVELYMDFTPSALGDTAEAFLGSNSSAGSLGSYPRVSGHLMGVNAAQHKLYNEGVVTLEYDSGSGELRYQYSESSSAGTLDTYARVLGYYEEIYKLTPAGAQLTY